MSTIYSEAQVKVQILSITLSLVNIAAEKWEKGEKDPQWVKRDDRGKFSKTLDRETDDEPNSSLKKTQKLCQDLLDLGKQKLADNRTWEKVTQVLDKPIFSSLLKSVTSGLSEADKELSRSFDSFSKFSASAMQEAASFSEYAKKLLVKQIEVVESNSGAKQLIKNTAIVLVVGATVGACLYANGLMDAALLAAKLSPRFAKVIGAGIRLPLYFKLYQDFITPTIKKISDWARLDKQKAPVIDESVKILDRVLKEQLTGDISRVSKALGISEQKADSVIAAATSLNIDPDKLTEALERLKTNKSARNQRNNVFIRVEELPKLIADRAKTEENSAEAKELENSLIWHKGIIEAEIKYGSTIDKLTNVSYSNTDLLIEAYQELLKIAKKKEGQHYKRATQEQIDALIKLENPARIDKEPLTKEQVKRRVDTVVEISKTFDSLIYPTLDVSIGSVGNVPGSGGFIVFEATYKYDEPKKFEFQKIMNGKDKMFLSVGSGLDPAVAGYHELGHALELTNSLVDISANYSKSRTLSNNENDFMWNYSGKLYKYPNNEPYATEVLSTGTQKLASPYHLHDFANKDRDHLLYTLYALDTKP